MKREILIIISSFIALPVFSDNERNDGKSISGRTYYNKSMDGSTWTNSTLTNINWSKSSLNSADFSNATIKDSYFESTSLSGANFSNTTLSNVDFSNSNLNGIFDTSVIGYNSIPTKYTNLSGVKGFTAENLKSTQMLSVSRGYNLGGVIFNGNDMSNWDLSDYNFFHCKFEGVNFSNAKLKGFEYSDLTNANFSGADFTNASFSNSIIKGANFSGGVAKGLTFLSIKGSASWGKYKDLSGINLSSNKLENWNFYNMNLSHSVLSNCSFVNNTDDNIPIAGKYKDFLTLTNFSGANLSNASFSGNEIKNVNFTGANLANSNFRGYSTTIKDVDFSGATLTSVDFYNTNFVGSNNFTDAKIDGTESNWTNFKNSYGFTEENFKSTVTFKSSNGNIKYISFGRMSNWNMSDLNFENCEIGVDGTNFTNSNFKNCKYNWGNASNFTNASFRGEDLTNADFRYSMLQNTDFTDCDISGATFSLSTKYGFTEGQLKSTKSYADGNLKGVGLLACTLDGWNFSNIDLTDASFVGSSVSNANFENAIIKNVNFRDTNLTKEQFESTKSYALKEVGKIDLSGKNLSGWNFSNQNMVGADFSKSDLTGADFTKARVQYSDFSGTNLSETQFNSFGHGFGEANFTDVDMSGWTIENQTTFFYTILKNTSLKNTTLDGITIRGGGLYEYRHDQHKIEKVDFTNAKIRQWLEFSNVKIFDSSFISMNASSSKILIRNFTTFVNCDFRGSNFDSTMFSDDNHIFGYNIIWTDGVLKKMLGKKAYNGNDGKTNFLTIRKFEGAKFIPVKISESDFNFGILRFEEGGILEVSNQKTLTANQIYMNTSLDGSSMLYIDYNAGLTVSKLTVDITEDILANDVYTVAIIEWEYNSRITGLSDLIMDKNLFLNVKGNKYNGYWKYEIKDNQFVIKIGQIPEPATYAAIFGALALAFAAYRRRK